MHDDIYAVKTRRKKIKKSKPLPCKHYTTLKQIKSKLSIIKQCNEHVIATNSKGIATIYQQCDNGLYLALN